MQLAADSWSEAEEDDDYLLDDGYHFLCGAMDMISDEGDYEAVPELLEENALQIGSLKSLSVREKVCLVEDRKEEPLTLQRSLPLWSRSMERGLEEELEKEEPLVAMGISLAKEKIAEEKPSGPVLLSGGDDIEESEESDPDWSMPLDMDQFDFQAPLPEAEVSSVTYTPRPRSGLFKLKVQFSIFW